MPSRTNTAPPEEEVVVDVDAASSEAPAGSDLPGSPFPTLDEAFACLCSAMLPLLEEDMTRQVHCQEIQGWYANGNAVVAWQAAIHLLEGVLGARLTAG